MVSCLTCDDKVGGSSCVRQKLDVLSIRSKIVLFPPFSLKFLQFYLAQSGNSIVATACLLKSICKGSKNVVNFLEPKTSRIIAD